MEIDQNLIDDSIKITFNYPPQKVIITPITKKNYFLDLPSDNLLVFPSEFYPSIQLDAEMTQGYTMDEIKKGLKKSKKEKIPYELIFEQENNCKNMKILASTFKDLAKIIENIYNADPDNHVYYSQPTTFNYFEFKVLYAAKNYKVTGSKTEIISESLLLRGFSSNQNMIVDSFVTTKFFGDEKWLYPSKPKGYPKMYFDSGVISLINQENS